MDGNKIVKKILTKFLIGLILYVMTIFMSSCYAKANASIYKESKQYVLNKSSKKIHISLCNSVIIMNDRNKKEVNDSLENLVNNGYSICKNCNAGIKKNFILEFFNNDDSFDLPTFEEYKNAIDIMGEWYVNHVPTYQTELESENISNYSGPIKYYKEYKLSNVCHGKKETINNYYVLSTDSNASNISSIEPNSKILAGSENAVKFYKSNYIFINKYKRKDTYYYPCNLINNSIGSYDKPGDDCVRFVFSVMNLANRSMVNEISKKSKIKWSHINVEKLLNNLKVEKALLQLGFEIYDSKINSNYNLISKDFNLKSGDLIIRNGHIHIFIGGENNLKAFGWGKVYRNYPDDKNFTLTLNEAGEYYFKSYELDNNEILQEKKYIRVIRYKGGN